MDFKDLTDDQKARAQACKTPEEMLMLAQEEGVDLTDEQLESVAGGWSCDDYNTESAYI